MSRAYGVATPAGCGDGSQPGRGRCYWLSLVLALPLAALAAEPISLFDGKTLDGWEVVERDKQFWRVEDGVIMADSLGKKMPRNTFMFSSKEYDNFEFRCMFRLTGQPKTGMVNSGIQFRSAKHGNGSAKGYQADIGEPKWWGCLYDEHRRGLIAKSDMSKLKGKFEPFGWNEYVIRAKGPVLTLFINGIQTIEYIEKDPKIPAKGHFALQLHSGGICRIEYKDITLKPLAYDGPKVTAPKTSATKTSATKTSATKLEKGEVMFADFESGTYDGWTVEGTAFGSGPIKISEVPKYQGDLKAKGRYCVNSHASAGGKDGAVGSLTSEPFKVTHDYIRFLIGGGNHKNQTCVNLLGEQKMEATVTGDSSNQMVMKSFSTKKYKGKMMRLQIVDAQSGGWGNIGVDEIVFTNKKPRPTVAKRVAKKRVGKKTGSGRTEAMTPQAQLAGFSVPEGFVVELVASEKDGVINPIDITFDDAGRLWTNTAKMYPMDPNPDASWGQTLKYMSNPDLQWADERFRKVKELYQRKTKGSDQLLVIENPGATPVKASVWADGLAIPQSFLPYKNGVFIAHGSEMLYLEDTDSDGKADKTTTVLSGFGYTDTHTMSHLLVRAPGGWVHYAHGALNKGDVVTVKTGERDRVDYAKVGRFSLDGMHHDVIVSGLNNIWGYTLRGNGQWFGSEANDQGHSITPMEPGTGYRGIGNARIRRYQPMLPPPNGFRVGGTGLSGLAFSDDSAGGFPDEWRNVGFLANPITSEINAVRTVRNPDGSVTSELLDDFLTSKDDWFRPVNVEFGPDGCLYIADFYNKIISHNEVSRSHPDRDKSLGRIWRIRYTGAKAAAPVNFVELPTAQLPEHLKSPVLWAKRAAWHQIVDRNAVQLAPSIVAICGDTSLDETTRILALWSLEGIGHYDSSLMSNLLQSSLSDLRREAVRAMGSMPVPPAELASMLKQFVDEKNVQVRSQVLRTLADYGKSSPELIDLAVSFCKPDSADAKLGGGYERKFERYLARMTLERYPRELDQYLNSALAAKQPASHVHWAAEALSIESRAKGYLEKWEKIKSKPLSAADFVAGCRLLRSPQISAAMAPVLSAPGSEYLVELASGHFTEVASPHLGELLSPTCERMLKSGDAAKIKTAIIALDRLGIEGLEAVVAGLLSGQLGDPAVSNSAIRILARNPTLYTGSFEAVLSGTAGPAATISAFVALVSADMDAAKKRAGAVLKGLPATAHAALAHHLSATAAGAKLLLDLVDEGGLADSALDRTLAERVGSKAKNDTRAKALLAKVVSQRTANQGAAHAKLKSVMKDIKGKNGDVTKGKGVFTAMCLSCHSVGGAGAGFAPALDGSAHRATEHLLTAVYDPDAAAEGNYTMYRVYKHDGSFLEGYLAENNPAAISLKFMGGATITIPREDIASSGFQAGRSVMPAGLIDGFSSQQVADLLAYIATLK